MKRGCARTFLVAAVLFVWCTPPEVKKAVIESLPRQPVQIVKGDTVEFRIAFVDKAERERFIDHFNRFVKEHEFLSERYDSGGVLTVFKILPPAAPAAVPQVAVPKPGPEAPAAPQQQAPVVPQQPAPAAEQKTDTARPAFGGTVRLYCPRVSLDYPVSALTEARAFCAPDRNDSGRCCFLGADLSAGSLTITTAGKLRNGSGKTAGALDIIEAWTRFGKEHPAELFALFRRCDGVADFLSGREALVRGISAADNATIRFRLSQPDAFAADRLASPRVLPAPLKLGNYFIKSSDETGDVLSANRSTAGAKPLLAEIRLRRGGDPNPLLSFSLNRYDAVLLWSAADLDYGRRNLLKNGICTLVGRDRYFLSFSLPDAAVRAFICSLLQPGDLLRNFVKADGDVLAAVEADNAPPVPAESQPSAAKPALPGPVKILYRKDDAVSKAIGERLLAVLGQAGIQAAAAGLDPTMYETALVNRDYGCAVGWVPETVAAEKCEKLRLAALWFGDDPDERSRIADCRELPLFSVNWYLLAKDRVGLYGPGLAGLHLKPETR